VYWVNGLAMKMPALLMSVSMRPNLFGDHALSGRSVGDVARDGQDIVITRRLDRSRCSHHAIVATTERGDEARPDALRRSGDHGNFSVVAHRKSPVTGVPLKVISDSSFTLPVPIMVSRLATGFHAPCRQTS
jgi:hypothetical protein